MQYAGGHLKELQKALKNPASNFGLLLGETAKRAGKMVGLAPVDGTLSANVHPNLARPAQLATMVSC
jgi:very long chain acyl-CoA dehydrogenase